VLAGRAAQITHLTVHGVGPGTRELDPGEAATWIDIAQFEHVLDLTMKCPAVRLTFNDGNDSDVHIALPRRVARGLTAEFFPLTGRIGDPGRIDRSGLRGLVAAGMPIGSHGWAHRDWRALDAVAAEQEIGLALRVLTDISGQPVSRVAVPFGSYDRTVLRRLRRAGVTRAYTSDGGRVRVDAWHNLRASNPSLDSPYFHRGFPDAVHDVCGDVQVVVSASASGTVTSLLPIQKQGRLARPAGWPVVDFQGPIIGPVTRCRPEDLIRAAGVRGFVFDHLLDGVSGFEPWIEARRPSPYLDVTGGLDAYLGRASRSGSRRDPILAARPQIRSQIRGVLAATRQRRS